MMKVLHLLAGGHAGGIEVLVNNYAKFSEHENFYLFVFEGGIIAEELRATGKNVEILAIRQKGIITSLRQIAIFCKEEKIEVIVEHHASPLIKLILLFIKIISPGILNVAYAHANAEKICKGNREKLSWLIKIIQKWGFRKADGVIAISNSVKESLISHLGIRPERIRVIYNGVPITSVIERKRNNKTIRMVYVGRLVEEKGVQITLRALAMLSNQLDFTFDIIGEGAYREELVSLTKELDLTNKVHFFGLCRNIPELLVERDIFIHMPECEEGFGITVVEAMAAGCICICGAKGGIPEIIQNGENGFLVWSNSEDELVTILQEVISNMRSSKYDVLRRQAVSRAEDFSIQKYVESLDAFLIKLQ